MCENDQCVVTKEDIIHSVEIEVQGIDVTDFNLTEIQTTISDLTGVDTDKLRIRVETDSHNEITKIIVIVDDEQTAEIISKTVNQCRNQQEIEGLYLN